MKKLWSKKKRAAQAPERITNDTVKEHRERILAGGRRFKYPMQYARHKLVFNTVIISVIALIVVAAVFWWQLYPAQNSSTFFYRVTRVLPLPVASVDGEPVRYSDYLMKYRGAIHYRQQKEQTNLATKDGKRQSDYDKTQAMDDAVADAYAHKLAQEHGLTVTSQQIDDSITYQRKSGDGTVSVATYNAVILDYYGWGPAEYRREVEKKLLRQEVAYTIDKTAAKQKDAIAVALHQPGADMEKVATDAGGSGDAKVQYGVSGWVPKTNQDGGRSTEAAKLKKGEISPAFRSTSGDGYYFVKLLDSNSDQVNYAFIKVPLTTFTQQLAAVEKAGKVHYYITLPDTTTQIKSK